jgi:hypothetical protein
METLSKQTRSNVGLPVAPVAPRPSGGRVNASVSLQVEQACRASTGDQLGAKSRIGLPVPQIEGDYEPDDFEQIKDVAASDT